MEVEYSMKLANDLGVGLNLDAYCVFSRRNSLVCLACGELDVTWLRFHWCLQGQEDHHCEQTQIPLARLELSTGHTLSMLEAQCQLAIPSLSKTSLRDSF